MADTELTTFVKESLQAGSSRAEIESVLAAAGWSKEQVTGALNRYASVDFRVPVPRPRAYLSARDTFLYLVMFSGETTVRFVLKALVAGGISGSVFVYYLREMRRDDEVLSR